MCEYLFALMRFSLIWLERAHRLVTKRPLVQLSTRNRCSDSFEAMVHRIYFWIGATASIDKKAAVAMCAVHLKNYVQSPHCSQRESQGDESVEFIDLFGGKVIETVPGGTESGFYEVEEEEHIDRLYLIETPNGEPARCWAMPPSKSSLNSSHVYLLETENAIFLWRGTAVPNVQFQAARLFAGKMRLNFRKPGSINTMIWSWDQPVLKELIEVTDGAEPSAFLTTLTDSGPPFERPKHTPKLFEVVLVDSKYIEIPQITTAHGRRFPRSALTDTRVFILDDGADMYLWKGRRSSRLVRVSIGSRFL